jgi:hypothetical protein
MRPQEALPPPRATFGSIVGKILLHLLCLLIAIACLAAYEHFKVEGQTGSSIGWLVAAAVFGFVPVRDVIRLVFGIEGKVLHLMHLVGVLGFLALPLTGIIKGTPILTHAAMAPFAIMGAAQAIMHQNHPRNAKQAAAMRRFAESLPELSQFTGGKLSSPATATRAVAVLSDIIAKAQALGQTELDADPRFQSALRQTSSRVGAKLGLDAVDAVLDKMAANPMTASAVPGLRKKLAAARVTWQAGTRPISIPAPLSE